MLIESLKWWTKLLAILVPQVQVEKKRRRFGLSRTIICKLDDRTAHLTQNRYATKGSRRKFPTMTCFHTQLWLNESCQQTIFQHYYQSM